MKNFLKYFFTIAAIGFFVSNNAVGYGDGGDGVHHVDQRGPGVVVQQYQQPSQPHTQQPIKQPTKLGRLWGATKAGTGWCFGKAISPAAWLMKWNNRAIKFSLITKYLVKPHAGEIMNIAEKMLLVFLTASSPHVTLILKGVETILQAIIIGGDTAGTIELLFSNLIRTCSEALLPEQATQFLVVLLDAFNGLLKPNNPAPEVAAATATEWFSSLWK